jgi:hypothetical protein
MLTILPRREPGIIRIANHIGIPSWMNATPAACRKNNVKIARAIVLKPEKLLLPC